MLDRLSELRKERKWSLQETADQLGIAKSTYAGYESGYREPSLLSLTQLAELFETTVDFLLGRTDETYGGHGVTEITEIIHQKNVSLFLDGKPLTPDEIIDFIAFIRTKRELKPKRSLVLEK
ncbi:helix-turn-helix transcriptional regulator [Paenibacillus sp. BSR1-1]|uniref:helix-turn-helix domain-containing protein n=1 Tax=Paenibacillus sp. BSR1-1 TaxID=3020845 RepID=UPI0025AFDA6A|nr:helix-turn-helix transcriptional regulator [Paenibacillus sp. BSR1-1]MDN3016061.1 helix-turn-helix transcriptional regulator [Paenibacillus sp. BSR1-1]